MLRLSRDLSSLSVRPLLESLEGRRLFTTYTIADLGLDAGASFGVNDSFDANNATANTGIDVNTKGAVSGTGPASLALPDLGNPTELIPNVGAPGFQSPLKVSNLGSSFSKGNDKGDLVGEYEDSNFTQHAFFSQLGAGNTFTTTGLGTLPKLQGSIAYAVNNKRQVVGVSGTLGVAQNGFVWQKNAAGKGVLTALPKLAAHGPVPNFPTTCAALAINDAGVIVGRSSGADLVNHAVLWTKKGTKWSITNITPPGAIDSEAVSINAKGFITGFYIGKDNHTHGFVRGAFSPGKTSFKIIATPAGFATVMPASINSKNQVVGQLETSGGTSTAFLWQLTGARATVTKLNNLLPANSGWNLDQAMSINTKGQIVGLGRHNTGEDFGFLLSPAT